MREGVVVCEGWGAPVCCPGGTWWRCHHLLSRRTGRRQKAAETSFSICDWTSIWRPGRRGQEVKCCITRERTHRSRGITLLGGVQGAWTWRPPVLPAEEITEGGPATEGGHSEHSEKSTHARAVCCGRQRAARLLLQLQHLREQDQKTRCITGGDHRRPGLAT